jgi:hypothetical protein
MVISMLPQLEAYAFMLENPLTGKAFPVSTMGLLVWNLGGVAQTRPNEFVEQNDMGFGVHQKYIPVERNPDATAEVCWQISSTVLDGDCPDAGLECHACNFLESRLRSRVCSSYSNLRLDLAPLGFGA